MQNNRSAAASLINAAFSAIMPAVILVAAYAIAGIYPMGDKLLMCAQNAEWYTRLLRYHDALMNGSGLFYTFAGGLGGDFYSAFVDGFCNPFWLISSVYSRATLPGAVPVIMIVQSAFAGFFTYAMLCRLCGQQKLAAAAFSTAYAAGSVMVLGFLAPQYVGAAVFLPLVGTGILSLCERGSTLLMFVSMLFFLASAEPLWPCLIIFSAVFFAWGVMVMETGDQVWARAALLIVCMGLAFGSTAVLWLPKLMSGAESGALVASVAQTDHASVAEIINGLFPGAFSSGKTAPLIFCSSMTLLMLPMYFFNPDVRLAERQLSAVSLLTVLVCMAVPALSWIWLCSADSTGAVVGFSFVYCVLVSAFAVRSLSAAENSSVRMIVLSWVLVALLFCVSAVLRLKTAPSELLIFSAAAMTLLAAITLVVLSNHSITAGFCVILMFCIACECLLGGTFSLTQAAKKLPLTTCDEYASEYNYQAWISSTITASEKNDVSAPFFRIRGAAIDRRNSVEASSASMKAAKELENALGIKDGEGYTPFTDAVFGIRYIVSDDGQVYTYPSVGSDGDSEVYRNAASMTIGWTVPQSVASLQSFNANPFIAQNQLAGQMAGAERTLFHTAQIAGRTGIGAGVTDTLTGMEIIRSEAKGYVCFTVLAPASGTLYMYIDCAEDGDEIARACGRNSAVTLGAVSQLGYCSRGETVEVIMSVTDERLTVNGIYFAVLDASLCSDTLSELSLHQLSYVAVDGGVVRGTVTSQSGEMLMTSIPFQSGWHVTVDGAETQKCAAAGALLAVPLQPGIHSVEMKYEPLDLTASIIVSMICFALGLIYACAAEAMCRRRELEEQIAAETAAEAETMPEQPEYPEYAGYAEYPKYAEYPEYAYPPQDNIPTDDGYVYQDFTVTPPPPQEFISDAYYETPYPEPQYADEYNSFVVFENNGEDD